MCTEPLLPVFAICNGLLCDQTCISRNSYFVLLIYLLVNSSSSLHISPPGGSKQSSAQIASTNYSVHSLGNVCDCPKFPLSSAVNQKLCFTGAGSSVNHFFQVSLLFQISSLSHLCSD